MSHAEERLLAIGLELPQPIVDESNNVKAVQVGSLLFVSAHIPTVDGQPVYVGVVGRDLDLEAATKAAQIVALSILATMKRYLGDLDRVKRIIRMYGVVASAPDFTMQNVVLNAASDLFIEAFGREAASGTRMPWASMALAHNYSMLIDMIVEVRE